MYHQVAATQLRLRIKRACTSNEAREQSAQMARARFSREASQLVKALAQCGSPFLQSSSASVSIRQLEYAFTAREAMFRVTDLSKLLSSAEAEPLSLTEAQTLLNSPLLDVLCSILSRLQWVQFAELNELDALESPMRGLFSVTCTVDLIVELLRTWYRVQSPSDTVIARQYTFDRYGRIEEERSALRLLGQAHLFHCTCRFQIAIAFVHKAVMGLAAATTAIARTGARAHAGNLALAKTALSLQQARVCSAQVDSNANIAHLPANGKPASTLR